MENILGLDLNELVSKEVLKKLEQLEDDKVYLRGEIVNRNIEITQLKKEIRELNEKTSKFEISNGLLDYIRNEYSTIVGTEETKNSSGKTQAQNQFFYIEKIMLNIFNIKKEYEGWYSYRDYGKLKEHLAINYYTNKDVLVSFLSVILNEKNQDIISYIKSFKMPYDYDKSNVVEYVKSPNYNTNGSIFGVSSFWIEGGCTKNNMPHDLIMKSPYILEEDVFALLVNTIERRRSNFNYLFALPEHNKNITTNQINQLGETLITKLYSDLEYDNIEKFIKTNMLVFNDKILDFLYGKVTATNQYNTLHWGNFPSKYQMKFLRSKTTAEVLKIITDYSCKWTEEEKEQFLKDYMLNK